MDKIDGVTVASLGVLLQYHGKAGGALSDTSAIRYDNKGNEHNHLNCGNSFEDSHSAMVFSCIISTLRCQVLTYFLKHSFGSLISTTNGSLQLPG